MDQGRPASWKEDSPSVSSNQVWLALSLLAYNLSSLWRRLARRIENWSLTSLQQLLVKTSGAASGLGQGEVSQEEPTS
jgi:hypothetical protein